MTHPERRRKSETVGTEVPVPHSWLADRYPSADSSTYEALANSKGANGLTVWESYLGYTYKVLGSRTLGADDWTEKSDIANRFFKVVLER